MGMVDLIKVTALKAVEASNPVNVLFGTVISASPIEIEIHQKLKLTKEFLVMTERVTKYEVDLEHNHGGPSALAGKLTDTPIRTGLLKGDKVVLLRVQGGQQFVVLDKVV
jgi:Protein of unknown function (DUF2577)